MTEIAGKISTKVLEEALKNTQEQTKGVEPGDSSFKETLNSTEESFNFAEMVGGEQNNKVVPNGGAQVMSAESVSFDATLQSTGSAEPVGGKNVVEMLSSFNDQQMQMDSLVNEIMYGGKRFNNQELLAIQAHVFHVAQLTEMTVKTVELGVSSLKGVMNTQIQ